MSALTGPPLQVWTALRLFALPSPLFGGWIMPRFWQSGTKDSAACLLLELAPKPCGNPCAQKCNKTLKCYIFCRYGQICQHSNQQALYKRLAIWSKFLLPLQFLPHLP